MQNLQTGKPADTHNLSHRLLIKEPSSRNPPRYAEAKSALSQITEIQQHSQP